MAAGAEVSSGIRTPDGTEARSGAWSVRSAWLSAAAALVLSAAAIWIHQRVPQGYRADLWGTPQPVVGLSAGLVGALIATRRPANRVAWLLVAAGVFAGVYCASLAVTEYGRAADPAASWLPWTGWVTGWAWLPVLTICLVLLPQVFPDGVSLPGKWLWWWRVTLAVSALAVAVLATAPEAPQFPGLANPLGLTVDGPWSGAVPPIGAAVLAVLAIGSIASILARVRRAGALLRRQIVLVSFASALLIASDFTNSAWLRGALCGAYLAAILVAVTRYRLYDIDVLVSRGAVGIGLVTVLGAAYAVTVAGVGALVGQVAGPGVATFAGALVVALAFAPVRERVRLTVDRAFRLGRPDPHDLLASVTSVVRDAPRPRQGVDDVAELLAERLPGRTVLIEVGPIRSPVYRAGEAPAADSVAVTLQWQGSEVGRATLGCPAGRIVDAVDHRTLAVLAPALGALAHDVLVTRELDLARQSVVSAREEERRRLRQDLHDGLGPLLAGALLSIDAARSASTRDDGAQLFDDAQDAVRRAIGDIRELVYALRPPALDDLGLAGAIRSTMPTGRLGLSMVCGDLGQLPAAVEVAAFRIVQEALTNAVRHADARSIEVRLHRSAMELHIAVSDDGRGFPAGQPRGVGLTSMRERASEVGGSLTVGPGEAGGTRVRAVLPCAEVTR